MSERENTSKTTGHRDELPPGNVQSVPESYGFKRFSPESDEEAPLFLFLFFSLSGVSGENSTGELQAAGVPMPGHESFALCAVLRSVKVTS